MRVASQPIKVIARGLLAALLLGVLWLFWPGRTMPAPDAAAAGDRYGSACTQPRAGTPGRHHLTTPRGLGYVVITPTDYRPTQGYGLLVLFPPAGFSRQAAERFYQITQSATAAGYLVALSDALPLSSHAMRAQADLLAEVTERWCIDRSRIVLAGHSDGGLMAQGTLIKGHLSAMPIAAIVSSAAGIQQLDLASESCPAPRHITLLHPANDERFPGYGWGVAQWWARCFTCEQNMTEPAAGQCTDAPGCRAPGSVRFCKTTTSHAQYPPEFGTQLEQLLLRLPRS